MLRWILPVVGMLLVGVFVYLYSDVRGELVNPFISSESVNLVGRQNIESEQTDSDLPLSCVLTYGTFFVTQKECDELTQFENSPEPSAMPISCEVPAGTFLVTQRECDILRNAKGSMDVMERIDD